MHLSYRSPSKDLKAQLGVLSSNGSRLRMLQEVLLQQEAEAHELRQVIAMKAWVSFGPLTGLGVGTVGTGSEGLVGGFLHIVDV